MWGIDLEAEVGFAAVYIDYETESSSVQAIEIKAKACWFIMEDVWNEKLLICYYGASGFILEKNRSCIWVRCCSMHVVGLDGLRGLF